MAKKLRRPRTAAAGSPNEAESPPPRGCLWIAALLTLGSGLLGYVMLRHSIVPAVRANHVYVETTCRLLDKQVERTRRDGTVDRRANFVEGRRGIVGGTPVFHVEYEVGGRTYSPCVRDDAGAFSSEGEKRRFFESVRVGETYPCWYDPTDPGRAVLVRGYGLGFAFMVLIPMAFLGAGVFSLRMLVGMSRKSRRAAGPSERA